MNRKTQQIIAVVVIIIVIVAGLAIVLMNDEPEVSEARAMILDVNDIQASEGGDWHQIGIGDHYPQRMVTAKSEADSELTNETISLLAISIDFFENDSWCQAVWIDWKTGSLTNISFYTTDPQIGNESYSDWTGSSNHVYLIFKEGNVLVWISVLKYNVGGWLNDSAISIAQLQLQKIDQYLAQHPGAS